MAYTTPMSGYYQQISKDATASTSGRQLLGGLGEQFAPTMGAAGVQAAGIRNQLGLIGPEEQLSNAYTSAMAGYQLGQLGIAKTKLGIQGTALGQEQQYQNLSNQLEQQEYGIQSQVYPEEQAKAALTHRNQLLSLQGQGAESGVQGATGQKEQLTTLGQQYGFQQADIARAQQLAGLGQQGTLAGQQYSTEQLANARKNLTLLAKSNGLSQTEVVTRLNYALHQNQISGVQSTMTLLSQLGDVYTGASEGLGNVLSLGGFVSGLNLFAGGGT